MNCQICGHAPAKVVRNGRGRALLEEHPDQADEVKAGILDYVKGLIGRGGES